MEQRNSKKRMELTCRDVGVDCDFVACGDTVEETIAACAEHAETNHGMMSFPPELWIQMRSRVRTIET
jgi:predicted small metal-binding protein